MERERTITWPGWEVVRLIGRGGFGEVYEIRRNVFGHEEKAALKVITIPQSNQDVEELRGDGYSGEEITDYFQSFLKDIVREYALMSEMKGHTNIIYCDDLRYIQHDDGVGWDIYIKMELLTPLPEALGQQVSDEQVIRVGIDICNALLLCEGKNIIHRDIKPQNIFVSDDGNYKLGDFGIAKTVERTASGTRIGTYKYIAPEVYNNQPYGSAADVYSLGLVLYWMLNERRTPFLPLPPQRPTASVDEEARRRRLSGESLPLPANGSHALQQIVMKACAFAPKSRYTAAELRAALEALLPAKKPEHFSNDDEETVLLVNEPELQPAELPNLSTGPHPVPEPASKTPELQPDRAPKPQVKVELHPISEKTKTRASGKKKAILLSALAAVILVVLLVAMPHLNGNASAGNTDRENETWCEGYTLQDAFPDEHLCQIVWTDILNYEGTPEEAYQLTEEDSAKILLWKELDLSQVTDATGLQFFTGLEKIYGKGSGITTLDVSQNVCLKELTCREGSLASITLGENAALDSVDIEGNQITELDVNGCPNLRSLACGMNTLSVLDIRQNPELETLSCGGNRLTELDISQNVKLKTLYCSYNQITLLDVSNNPQLTESNMIYDTKVTVVYGGQSRENTDSIRGKIGLTQSEKVHAEGKT